jgi:hypothetical protein
MGEAMAESVDELLAMGGDALAGRRVQRLLPGGRGVYEGTVVGAAGRPDRLVAIDYDNGDVEELDAGAHTCRISRHASLTVGRAFRFLLASSRGLGGLLGAAAAATARPATASSHRGRCGRIRSCGGGGG